MRKKLIIGTFSLALVLTLSACGADNEEENHENMDMDSNSESHSEEMDHSGTGEVPEGLKVADNPTYELGTQVLVNADHMEGMKGAEATIVGAFDTTVYAISYTPTTGGERVENHKWVIHEEILGANEEPFEPGTEVTLDAEHMKGMNEAKAEIVSAEETTVYMIDYVSPIGGEKITFHKWVTESELSAAD